MDYANNKLNKSPKTWLITGVAGFIGSNLLEELLKLGQTVVGLDNYSTGYKQNLFDVQKNVGEDAWGRFVLIKGDIRNIEDCRKACKETDYVLHQAALGSVPRSIDDPVKTNQSNVDGFLNMLIAAKEARVKRFIFAASSSTYGDHPQLPKKEDVIGRPLSPYAVTKYVNELYADVFAKTYGLKYIGHRYFNVFGKRQDPNGAYAAVIPRWIGELLNNEVPTINGNGETSRDFCYIDNVVQANILAAISENDQAINQIYNVAFSQRTTLNELFLLIVNALKSNGVDVSHIKPVYGPFLSGDVKHSQADIEKAKFLLGYSPKYDVAKGLEKTVIWFMKSRQRQELKTD